MDEKGEAESDGHKVCCPCLLQRVYSGQGALPACPIQPSSQGRLICHPLAIPCSPFPPQITLMAVMVTQFPMRLSVYAEQFSDVAANKVSSSGGDGDRR